MTTLETELVLATELADVLAQLKTTQAALATLNKRRQELLTSLHDGLTSPDKPVDPQPAPPARVASTVAPAKPKTRKKPVVEPITPEQQKDYETMDELYGAGIEKASDAQKRMIFALLKDFDDADKKAVIRAIVANLHHGWLLESTKDLSKAWAGDVITYVQDHTTDQLKLLIEPF